MLAVPQQQNTESTYMLLFVWIFQNKISILPTIIERHRVNFKLKERKSGTSHFLMLNKKKAYQTL